MSSIKVTRDGKDGIKRPYVTIFELSEVKTFIVWKFTAVFQGKRLIFKCRTHSVGNWNSEPNNAYFAVTYGLLIKIYSVLEEDNVKWIHITFFCEYSHKLFIEFLEKFVLSNFTLQKLNFISINIFISFNCQWNLQQHFKGNTSNLKFK